MTFVQWQRWAKICYQRQQFMRIIVVQSMALSKRSLDSVDQIKTCTPFERMLGRFFGGPRWQKSWTPLRSSSRINSWHLDPHMSSLCGLFIDSCSQKMSLRPLLSLPGRLTWSLWVLTASGGEGEDKEAGVIFSPFANIAISRLNPEAMNKLMLKERGYSWEILLFFHCFLISFVRERRHLRHHSCKGVSTNWHSFMSVGSKK